MISEGGLKMQVCEKLRSIARVRTAAHRPPAAEREQRSAYSWHQAKSNASSEVGVENIEMIRDFWVIFPETLHGFVLYCS
jgi:hypothetical protein